MPFAQGTCTVFRIGCISFYNAFFVVSYFACPIIMARIFTIDFEFRGANHAAIVSTYKGETLSDSFQIMLCDDALHHLVPDGIIRFSMTDSAPGPKATGRDELVQCLKNAITGHLQKLAV